MKLLTRYEVQDYNEKFEDEDRHDEIKYLNIYTRNFKKENYSATHLERLPRLMFVVYGWSLSVIVLAIEII